MAAEEEEARHDRVLDFITLDAGERVALLWLDELQWADETLRFVEHAVAKGQRLLLLGTLDGNHLDERLEASGAQILEVRSRGREAGRQRLAACLGLSEGPVLERLLTLCGDDLMYARLVLDDWIEDGVVTVQGVPQSPLPDTDLRRTWDRRVDDLLATRGEGTLDALAAAAVLGDEVGARRHRDVCRREHIELEETLIDELMARGMAVPVGLDVADWRFASPVLRSLVLDRARLRLPALHLAAARSYRVEPTTRLLRAWHFGQAEQG